MEKKIHTLPELSYAYHALEPFIDEETMKIHHGKHHVAYVNNLNTALEKHEDLQQKSAEDLLLSLNHLPEEIRTAVRNNAGGHVNHTMFWQIMRPNGGEPPKNLGEPRPSSANDKREPSGVLMEEIKKNFGSFEEFKNKFNDAGLKRFGSGWVWLVLSKEGKLDIISTANQDNPMTDGYKPIMGNDVWEHAYYLKYRNMRGDYLKAWWNLVNWQEIEKRFNEKA